MLRGLVRLPLGWWARQSLRGRLTLVATALFSVAVVTGAVLVLVLQRYALVRTLDSSAAKSAHDIAQGFTDGKRQSTVTPTTSGIEGVQVVDQHNAVIASSPGEDGARSLLATLEDLREVRAHKKIDIQVGNGTRLRVYGRKVGPLTVLVYTDLDRVDDSIRLLEQAALIGCPVAVLLMALATYSLVTLTLRSVAALRHGAADITAAGLAEQRLPVPTAKDEIHRLATTLNAMLDRIDSATQRQRTFVGDAAHELRSPLASLRVQLEVAARLGPAADWDAVLDDVLIDVGRLDRLVADLLALARLDETHGDLIRNAPVELSAIIESVVAGYEHARVPVTLETATVAVVEGDPDGLRRIAINLIDNAERYAVSGITVSLRPGALRGQPAVVLCVLDDGPGIPASERSRVFDRFYRLHSSRSRDTGGTGLGLAIVRDVVNAHHGTVRLGNREDGRSGLLATVTLPARTSELPAPATSA
jgi:signal transduction histidine kinase